MKRLFEIRKIKLQLLFDRNPFLNYLININDENNNKNIENFDSEYYKKKKMKKLLIKENYIHLLLFLIRIKLKILMKKIFLKKI